MGSPCRKAPGTCPAPCCIPDIARYESDIARYESDIARYESDIASYESDIARYEALTLSLRLCQSGLLAVFLKAGLRVWGSGFRV